MWVFGYGSLLCDDWWSSEGCLHTTAAELPGFRRAFSKASVKNWGTRRAPAPTLNLEPAPGSVCRGLAYEFPDASREGVLRYLKKREGGGLCEVEIRLDRGANVKAFCFIYAGSNIIRGKAPAELAAMALAANGQDGTGLEYVQKIVRTFAELQIHDPAIAELYEAIQQQYPRAGS